MSTPVLVGGGNWLYVTPGIGVLVAKGINLQADVKVPVYRRLPIGNSIPARYSKSA